MSLINASNAACKCRPLVTAKKRSPSACFCFISNAANASPAGPLIKLDVATNVSIKSLKALIAGSPLSSISRPIFLADSSFCVCKIRSIKSEFNNAAICYLNCLSISANKSFSSLS